MTTDEFNKKCDEIHTIVCYLVNDNNLSKPIYGMMAGGVEIAGFYLERNHVVNYDTLSVSIQMANYLGIKNV